MYETTKPYIEKIEAIIRSTWDTKYLHVDVNGIYKKDRIYRYIIDFHHTDGIGTKGVDHWRERTFHAAVQDALAMNLNDFCLARAIPTAICDHILIPEDDHEAIVQIVSFLAAECRMRDIAITAGETAIHSNLKGLEISITMSGFKRNLEPNQFHEGDILIGIESSGPHANGFTKIHELFGDAMPRVLTAPTLVYFDYINKIDRVYGIHGMTHITGGGFTKIKRFLGSYDAHIGRQHHLQPHAVFWDLLAKGVPEKELYRTFNCGIGFIIGVDYHVADACVSILKTQFNAAVIGNVISGTGKVHIASMFSGKAYIV